MSDKSTEIQEDQILIERLKRKVQDLKAANVALREVLAKCRQRFRDYEMDAETLPPRHHFEAMVEIDDVLGAK